MFDPMTEAIPEHWQNLFELLSVPIAWIPDFTRNIFDYLSMPDGWMATFTYLFLFLPVMLVLGGIWITQLSFYTLPFRSGRVNFIKTMLMAWWDTAMAIWLFWVGLGRVVFVALGWLLGLGRLALQIVMEIFRQLIILPFTKTGQMTQSYFQPGVPWVAFLMLLFWGLLEAVIFTYTLFPTVTEVLSGMDGQQASAFMGPILFIFLSVLILGSFACLQALADAINHKDYKYMIQMVLVEIFVMTFEVLFLYRELVDAITPWIAQQTGENFLPGIGFTLSLAAFGWVGIRGMTWFLFGQYGTPPLLAIISRRPMLQLEGAPSQVSTPPVPIEPWWKAPLQDLKREIGWLHEKAHEVLEFVALPFIHLVAGLLNFAMILVTGQPVFMIPFKNFQEALQMRETLSLARLQPRKAAV